MWVCACAFDFVAVTGEGDEDGSVEYIVLRLGRDEMNDRNGGNEIM